MSTEDVTPRPDDSVSLTTGACCSYCGRTRDEGLVLVEAPGNVAYICGDCALKCTHMVFAHKRTLTYKLIHGLMPFLLVMALGGALCWHFLEEEMPIDIHIAAALFMLGFFVCHQWHFWWPDDDLLPRRPWF